MPLNMDDLIRLPDDQLLKLWRAQEPSDRGTDPEQDVLAAELERRGLDV